MERAISCMEISLNSCNNLSEPGLSKVSAIEISSHMVDTINASSDMFTYQKHFLIVHVISSLNIEIS